MTDISELFIKMVDCPEIQENIPQSGIDNGIFIGGNIMYHTQSRWDKEHGGPPEGVYYFIDEHYTEECHTCGNREDRHRTVKCIWLPDQYQLQEMLRDRYDLENMLVEFYCFVSGRIPLTNEIIAKPLWNAYKSMEQFWFAFVMKEKYNKEWDGNQLVSCVT